MQIVVTFIQLSGACIYRLPTQLAMDVEKQGFDALMFTLIRIIYDRARSARKFENALSDGAAGIETNRAFDYIADLVLGLTAEDPTRLPQLQSVADERALATFKPPGARLQDYVPLVRELLSAEGIESPHFSNRSFHVRPQRKNRVLVQYMQGEIVLFSYVVHFNGRLIIEVNDTYSGRSNTGQEINQILTAADPPDTQWAGAIPVEDVLGLSTPEIDDLLADGEIELSDFSPTEQLEKLLKAQPRSAEELHVKLGGSYSLDDLQKIAFLKDDDKYHLKQHPNLYNILWTAIYLGTKLAPMLLGKTDFAVLITDMMMESRYDMYMNELHDQFADWTTDVIAAPRLRGLENPDEYGIRWPEQYEYLWRRRPASVPVVLGRRPEYRRW